MPFITEEIWQRIAPLAGKNEPSLMLQPYPDSDSDRVNHNAVIEMEWIMSLIMGVRRIRGEMNIPPSKQLTVLFQDGSDSNYSCIENNRDYIMRLGRIETLECLPNSATPPESAMTMVGELKILIPMGGFIDKDAELSRLDKEVQRIMKELPRLEGKLSDSGFLDKAPMEVVQKEQNRLNDLRLGLSELRSQMDKIKLL
jgi:valyl-tRNA synthetase